jgi:pre-mRNA-processing factor SLU7
MAWREFTVQDRKKQRDLDEARKSGKLPFELDEDGNEINPHIPNYIKNAPWYINGENGQPSFKTSTQR